MINVNINKEVDSAEWFKDADKWLKICFGYNNPINYGSIHSELLLIKSFENLMLSTNNSQYFMFYGIGSGDTEMQILDIFSERHSEVICFGIDINLTFLNLFENSVRLQLIEKRSCLITFESINSHFNKMSRPVHKRKTLNIYVLGSTIGNYNQVTDFINTLGNVVANGDRIYISFQTDKYLTQVFEKYKNNELYNDLINVKNADKNDILWVLKKNKIEAYYKDIQLFRSVKYSPKELQYSFEQCGYRTLHLKEDISKNLALLILEKD